MVNFFSGRDKKLKRLTTSVFNFVPGVPRVKVELFGTPGNVAVILFP